MSVARLMQQAAAGSAGAGPEPSGWTDPDLGNASYDSVSFSVSGQETSPQGMFFKPDGAKVYIIGAVGDDVNEYDLSTAWDISTASYVQNFSVSSEQTTPRAIHFKSDGSKMYVLGSAGVDISEYSLSTSWDISTASYVQNFSVSGQDTVPQGLFLREDGSKMYVVGSTGDNVYEYSLSTAWDISTASYAQNFSVAGQDIIPTDLFLSPTGLKVYVVGSTGDAVYEYSLSTAWDISTASYSGTSFSVASQEITPTGLFFKFDGSKLYVVGATNDTIYQYSTATTPPAEWTDPDLANASYDSVSFNVAGQDATPTGFYIGDNGSKLYVSGNTNDSIYQYTLTTPWDLSSASYDSVSISVSGQDSQPNGITFKPDGTVMYVSGNAGDDVNQYSLSTAWDLSTASFDSKTLSINAQDPTPRGLAFNSDGSILLVVGGTSDTIYQYDLTTPWDISTGSYALKSFDTTTQETGPYGIYLSPNEDKFWLLGFSADAILQYSVTSADISTTSYDNVSFSVSAQDSSPYTVFFKSDGSKAYVLGATNDTIYQYSTATTPPAEWTDPDLANSSYDSVSFSVAGQETSPEALFFKPDGAKMYVLGATGDDVNEYDLSIAWDISTASYVQNFSVAAEELGPSGLFFKPDGTKMYVTGFDGDDVNEYDLSSAWDISTASYLQNFSVSSQVVTPRGLFFKPDGTKMYVSGTTNDAVFEYSLSAAWDISSASYVQSFSVVTQDNAPEDVSFNPDGTKMYVVGDQANRVYEYDLSAAWDISTATYNSISFGVGTQDTSPNGVFFKSDGSRMYVVGSATDTIYQYSTA